MLQVLDVDGGEVGVDVPVIYHSDLSPSLSVFLINLILLTSCDSNTGACNYIDLQISSVL